MLIAALLVLALLLCAFFVYIEAMEMAIGAFVSAVLLASVGFVFKLAAVMTILSIVGIALLIGVGYLLWRVFGRNATPGDKGPSVG